SAVFEPKDYASEEDRNVKIFQCLQEADIQMVLLAGYMRILSADIVRSYRNRIINIHPSLIPKYCGMGYYGKRVHEAVLTAGEKETGATVHFVDEGVDTGDIILQRKVKVLDDDTADVLAERVLNVEHEIIVEAVALVVQSLGGEK
ncbi:MAG: phosphoribosylglycinamide formyltransferase, partial [Clostridiales Family XIII bacterium]|nr:phosphoribosylglycinamide formyltransferase [Clostridiales Family XIII bacterium]